MDTRKAILENFTAQSWNERHRTTNGPHKALFFDKNSLFGYFLPAYLSSLSTMNKFFCYGMDVSAQYFGEPEFMWASLDNDWRLRNIQTSLLRGAKARRYSHHGGEVYNPARNSP